jgi:hypothetical protein
VEIEGPFYWFTYAMIWALPLAGLSLAIRGRDRALLAVSIAMMLVTLLTNKAYLGWPRHEWDPMVLGAFLMAAAIIVRRWLSAGANGQRAGFTSSRILSRQTGALTLVETAAVAFRPDAGSFPKSEGFEGGGGRSGGGGATADDEPLRGRTDEVERVAADQRHRATGRRVDHADVLGRRDPDPFDAVLLRSDGRVQHQRVALLDVLEHSEESVAVGGDADVACRPG